MIAGVLERHGRIDILVNNAGITRDQLMLRMKRDDWDEVIATNLTAAFALRAGGAQADDQAAQRAASSTSARWSGRRATPGQANYAASKAGLIGFSKALARELASRNITVNVVAPGLHRDRHDAGDHREGAGRLGGADSARAAGHAGGRRRGSLFSRLG